LADKRLQILPSRIVEFYPEDITSEAIEERLRLVRKKANGLKEGHHASHIASSVTQSTSGAALGSSSTRLAPEGCSAAGNHEPVKQDHEVAAKRLVDRDRRIRKESIAAHEKRQASRHGESATTKKRARKHESSDSDTDAHWMTPRRYVRPSPEMSARNSRQEIVVLIPQCNIDKSLYIPYVSPLREEPPIAEPNLDATLCSPRQRRSSGSIASQACRRRLLMAPRYGAGSGIRDGMSNRLAERSVPSYGWIPSIDTDDGKFWI
jgi:hypothetical protein